MLTEDRSPAFQPEERKRTAFARLLRLALGLSVLAGAGCGSRAPDPDQPVDLAADRRIH